MAGQSEPLKVGDLVQEKGAGAVMRIKRISANGLACEAVWGEKGEDGVVVEDADVFPLHDLTRFNGPTYTAV